MEAPLTPEEFLDFPVTPVEFPRVLEPLPSLFTPVPLRLAEAPTKILDLVEKDFSAFGFRTRYQALQPKAKEEEEQFPPTFTMEAMFPREGVYGGIPLLVWKEREQKFIIIAGWGRENEGPLVKKAKEGQYEHTVTVDCRAPLKDPPEGKIEDNSVVLESLANEIRKYWNSENIENIVVYCFAGQNRSVASTLLFLMLYVYKPLGGETSEGFARRLLTLLSGSRPAAFFSIENVHWIGEKTEGYPFSWFQLVIYSYEKKKFGFLPQETKVKEELMIF